MCRGDLGRRRRDARCGYGMGTEFLKCALRVDAGNLTDPGLRQPMVFRVFVFLAQSEAEDRASIVTWDDDGCNVGQAVAVIRSEAISGPFSARKC